MMSFDVADALLVDGVKGWAGDVSAITVRSFWWWLAAAAEFKRCPLIWNHDINSVEQPVLHGMEYDINVRSVAIPKLVVFSRRVFKAPFGPLVLGEGFPNFDDESTSNIFNELFGC